MAAVYGDWNWFVVHGGPFFFSWHLGLRAFLGCLAGGYMVRQWAKAKFKPKYSDPCRAAISVTQRLLKGRHERQGDERAEWP
jgi:hypothetical protein